MYNVIYVRYCNKSLAKGKLISTNFTHCYHVVFELWLSCGCMSGPPRVTRFTGHISWSVLFVRTRPAVIEKGRKHSILLRSWTFWVGTIAMEKKTRMKITTGCSGTQEGYSSFISGCFMFMLENTEETHSPEVLPFFHYSINSLIEIP